MEYASSAEHSSFDVLSVLDEEHGDVHNNIAAALFGEFSPGPITIVCKKEPNIPANFTKEEQVGADIVARALSYPVRQIADNAGKEWAVVVNKIRNHDDINYGYDAARDEYKDLVKVGIIDPTKVERSALENAISIAGMFLTTEALIVENPKEEKETHSHGGGMGGMGGMGMY